MQDEVPHGSADMLRAEIAEMLGLAAIQCDLAQTHAAIGDDVGLAYAISRFAAYARAAVGIYDDLRQHRARSAGQKS